MVLCDGEAMVIDGGPAGSARYVYSYLRDTLRLSHLDYVISTHPHIDHAGGLAAVLNAVPADLLLTPVKEWDSKAFRAMLDYADRQGTAVAVPQAGDTLRLGRAAVTILHCWPEAIGLGRTNDASIVLRVDYGETSFLFTGDAEDWAEYMMIDAGASLKANVLKVSHHGSYTATTEEFLRRFGVDSRKDLPTVTPDQEAEIAQEVEKEVKYRFGLETSETEARENDAAENREEGQQEAAEGQEKAPEEN